jgi:hypothetical protein
MPARTILAQSRAEWTNQWQDFEAAEKSSKVVVLRP